MIGSPYLDGRTRYERITRGWVDNTHDDAFTHTVRIEDDDASAELTAVCTASPGYEVKAARARVLGGAIDPDAAAAFSGLAGIRMVAGFTRRLLELGGGRPGAGLLIDAALEVARLARQVAKLPGASVAGLGPRDARRFWELDTTSWVDLPDSCFTYTQSGRALFESRTVVPSMTPELYAPPAGAMRIFDRRKLARLVRTGNALHLFHAMHDNVHGFDLHYEIDLDAQEILSAQSVTSRLPYTGICSEPQARIRTLEGERVDAGLRRRIQTLLGGDRGCAQLYDLTADLLKLLTLT